MLFVASSNAWSTCLFQLERAGHLAIFSVWLPSITSGSAVVFYFLLRPWGRDLGLRACFVYWCERKRSDLPWEPILSVHPAEKRSSTRSGKEKSTKMTLQQEVVDGTGHWLGPSKIDLFAALNVFVENLILPSISRLYRMWYPGVMSLPLISIIYRGTGNIGFREHGLQFSKDASTKTNQCGIKPVWAFQATSRCQRVTHTHKFNRILSAQTPSNKVPPNLAWPPPTCLGTQMLCSIRKVVPASYLQFGYLQTCAMFGVKKKIVTVFILQYRLGLLHNVCGHCIWWPKQNFCFLDWVKMSLFQKWRWFLLELQWPIWCFHKNARWLPFCAIDTVQIAPIISGYFGPIDQKTFPGLVNVDPMWLVTTSVLTFGCISLQHCKSCKASVAIVVLLETWWLKTEFMFWWLSCDMSLPKLKTFQSKLDLQ